MNDKQIKSFYPILTIDSESYFECILVGDKKMEIALWSFYEFVFEEDKGLKTLGDTHDEWESLTKELIEFGYPFEDKLNQYIQQFTNKEINEFTHKIEY